MIFCSNFDRQPSIGFGLLQYRFLRNKIQTAWPNEVSWPVFYTGHRSAQTRAHFRSITCQVFAFVYLFAATFFLFCFLSIRERLQSERVSKDLLAMIDSFDLRRLHTCTRDPSLALTLPQRSASRGIRNMFRRIASDPNTSLFCMSHFSLTTSLCTDILFQQ